MILRPASPEEFHVVAFCFVHGLTDGESLLGSLLSPWKLQMLFLDGSYVPDYVDTSTLEHQSQDPRLESLTDEWELVHRDRTQDDPAFFQHFRNKRTGEVMNSDPRLLPEALVDTTPCPVGNFQSDMRL